MVVPLLNIPIISVVLLLLAGILIGHLIWYRDRSDDESTLSGLRGENHELQAALHEHKQAYVALEADIEDQRKETDQLKAANKQLELAHQSTDHDLSELNNEITRLQHLKDQAFHDLDQERQHRRALQEALATSEENTTRSNVITEQLQSQVAAFEAERRELTELANSRLVDKEAVTSDYGTQLEKLQEEHQQLQQERDELLLRLEQPRTTEMDLETSLQLERLQEQLAALVIQRDELQRHHDEFALSMSEAVGKNEILLRERDELAARLAELETNSQGNADLLTQIADLHEQTDTLVAERNSLLERLRQDQNSEKLADTQVVALTSERDAARAESAELNQTLQRLEKQLQSSEESLASLRYERDEYRQQVDDERASRERMEQQVTKVDELLSQRDAAMSRASLLEEQIASMQERIEQMDGAANEELLAENEKLRGKLATLTQEHDAVATMLVDERTRLSRMESDNHRLSLLASESSQRDDSQLLELKSQIEHQTIELDTLRSELEETAAQLGRERHQRQHLQDVLMERKAETESSGQERAKLDAELQSLTTELQTLTTQNSSLAAEVEELTALRGEHASVKHLLHEAHQELSELRTKHEGELAERESLAARIHELNGKSTELTRRIVSLSAERSSLEVSRDAAASERDSIASELEKLVTERDVLASEREALAFEKENFAAEKNSVELERDTLGVERDTLELERDTLQAERDEIKAQLESLERDHRLTMASKLELESSLEDLQEETHLQQQRIAELEGLREEYRDQASRIDKVAAQRDEAMHTQADLQAFVADLRSQVESQTRTISALNQQNDQLRSGEVRHQPLRQENEQLRARLNETSEQLDRATAHRDQLSSQMRELEATAAQLETKAKSSEATIESLRRERDEIVARTHQAIQMPTSPFASRSVPEASGGRMRRDDVLGMVYTQPPKRKDDLKRISGIAQVLEKKLNAFGVYTYRQIMEWDPVAVAEFSKLLSFRDRIERDDWVGQARNLHYETYGRAA